MSVAPKSASNGKKSPEGAEGATGKQARESFVSVAHKELLLSMTSNENVGCRASIDTSRVLIKLKE